ncbi:unnamed protein product [Rhizophagus irregularis]|nr:unnamed protein product [Rhizophagus irregularis]
MQLPGRQNIFIIGVYIPPSSGLNNKLISKCHSTLISWITVARSTGAHILLGGDLNAEFDSYLKNISDPTILSPVNSLFRYLHSHQFDDLCTFDSSFYLLPTFQSLSSNHLSRLDYLWTSPAFPAAYLWSYILDSSDTLSTDHFLLIGFFDFLNIHDLCALSYLKQRSRYRTEFNMYAALPKQKILFTAEVDSGLKKFSPPNGDSHLNNNWHRLKSALLNAARDALPKRVISLNKPQAIPFELRPITHLSHKLDHYINSLFKIFSISNFYSSWNWFFTSFYNEFINLFFDQNALIDILPTPTTIYSVFISSHLDFPMFLKKFRSSLRTIKKFISGKLTMEFDNYKQVAMKVAIAERNSNFYEDKEKFICSSLNYDIHKAAIKHFQNVVGPSRSPFKTLEDLPDRWKSRYTPIFSINSNIYLMVIVPITEAELLAIINNSPHHKAPGPSSISYEWFRLLSSDVLL